MGGEQHPTLHSGDTWDDMEFLPLDALYSDDDDEFMTTQINAITKIFHRESSQKEAEKKPDAEQPKFVKFDSVKSDNGKDLFLNNKTQFSSLMKLIDHREPLQIFNSLHCEKVDELDVIKGKVLGQGAQGKVFMCKL